MKIGARFLRERGYTVEIMRPPRYFRFVFAESGAPVARVERAETWLSKGVGVLGRSALPEGVGLWLPDVASIHTCFVAFPLDIVFLSRDFFVLAVYENTPSWRALVRCAGAAHTIELGAGTLARCPVVIGSQMRLETD